MNCNVRINVEDARFLRKHLKRSAHIFNERTENLLKTYDGKPGGTIQVSFSPSEITEMLDELGDLFSELGLQANHEPNVIGRKVEAIIDIFNRANFPPSK
jgi:hypothetical protein